MRNPHVFRPQGVARPRGPTATPSLPASVRCPDRPAAQLSRTRIPRLRPEVGDLPSPTTRTRSGSATRSCTPGAPRRSGRRPSRRPPTSIRRFGDDYYVAAVKKIHGPPPRPCREFARGSTSKARRWAPCTLGLRIGLSNAEISEDFLEPARGLEPRTC